MYIYTYTCMYVYIFVHVSVCVCVCLCVFVCGLIYKHVRYTHTRAGARAPRAQKRNISMGK